MQKGPQAEGDLRTFTTHNDGLEGEAVSCYFLL